MTQEEKELLLKDLSARLPYGVKCHFKYGSAEDDITLSCIDNNVARFEYGWYGRFHVIIDADYIKPYLRPMSSMTEEEIKEHKHLIAFKLRFSVDELDWLNKKMFAYRTIDGKDMFKLGLALEAPEDMYKEE